MITMLFSWPPRKILLLCTLFYAASAAYTNNNDDTSSLEKRLHDAKMELWSRGEFNTDTISNGGGGVTIDDVVKQMEAELSTSSSLWSSSSRLGPVREARRDTLTNHRNNRHSYDDCFEFECGNTLTQNIFNRLQSIRGGAMDDVDGTKSSSSYNVRLQDRLNKLGVQYGPDFIAAIKENEEEHAEDCEISCQSFYCASSDTTTETNLNGTTFHSYNFGATPPEDFADEFGFPLDIIKVSEGTPLFSPEEAAQVVQTAQSEGIEHNEYQSGKYKLGGDWLLNLPKTRAWFNRRLETTFFPLLTELFPEIVSSESVLRAHSVSLLKYNVSHPRTDVHVDNGILAMTLAMTPKDEYTGGGTFFEHMGVDNVLPMDVGQATLRPGSVRHGGHKVTKGTRYILGAFLLITDRVEHVRRLKNRGSKLRRTGDLEGAAKHFEWALGINPKCTTCLKDWAEILLTQKKLSEAESKLRLVLDLLEGLDSDALFSLGIVLSEQGKDDESIDAYMKSVQLNAEDAQLCYNLGIKLGAKGDKSGEMKMYAKATSVDPKFGGAWLNWGTSLAEDGNMSDAEIMFLKALTCEEVRAKAMMNLALLNQKKANEFAATGDLQSAKSVIESAASYLDQAKPILEDAMKNGQGAEDDKRYASQIKPLRVTCHRILGSIYAGMKDYDSCEKEFLIATKNFPEIPGVWEMLARVLEAQGKIDEAQQARNRFKT